MKRNVKKADKVRVDKKLFTYIQPRGGLSFMDERIIKNGTGYEACLHVYSYPQHINNYWLTSVCNINDVVTTISINTDNINEVKKNINKSLKEQAGRFSMARDFSEKYEAQIKFNELELLYREIASMGEVAKLIHVRIFISSDTIDGLNRSVAHIKNTLEASDYDASVFMNESKDEWRSIYLPYKDQKNNAFALDGFQFLSESLAAGLPFYFSSLEDDFGSHLGFTPCGGAVLFDLFAHSSRRRSYNMIASGTMGAGKSSLLKKQFLDRAARGDFIRCFDVTGEFVFLTQQLGGKVIGPEAVLNPLEILQADENENGNYAKHISKLSIMYKYLAADPSGSEVIIFENLLRSMYVDWGLIPEDAKDLSGYKISNLPADKYPTFSDFLNYINQKIKDISSKKENKMESQLTAKNLLLMDNVRKTIENICLNYGTVFDGHSSIENLQGTQIVTFDISQLKAYKDAVFDAQIFNLVSLSWDNAVANGRLMKNAYESKKIDMEDILHTLIIIDESPKWINAKKVQALDQVLMFAREGRKWFTGIAFAGQSIRDYVPEQSTAEGVDAIKTLFELSTYKFLFHQDPNVSGMLESIFDGQLTESELKRIPKLEQGQCLLSIASDKNIELKVNLTTEENMLFRGGV